MKKDYNILEIDEIHFSDSFDFLPEQKEIFLEVASWKTPPPLVKTGRSSYLILQEPSLPFKGIKIKGCGFFDLPKETIAQPSTSDSFAPHIQKAPDGVKEVHYKIELDENFEPEYKIPTKKAFGGQTFARAKCEFETCQNLYNAYKDNDHFPFYYPIGYGRYKDLSYSGKVLGFTILGVPTEVEVPMAVYFDASFEERGLKVNPHIIDYWKRHSPNIAKLEPNYFDLLTTLRTLSFELGTSLRNLHEHYTDYATHVFNGMVNAETGKVVIFDLDHVLANSEMASKGQFYYSLKDFEVGLVSIMSTFILSGLASGVSLFQESGKAIDEYNVLEGFFEGYFGELTDRAKKDVKVMWENTLLFIGNTLLNTEDHLQRLKLTAEFCEKQRVKSFIDLHPYLLRTVQGRNTGFTLSETEHQKIISNLLKQKESLAARL